MRSKKLGLTLMETVISLFLVSMVLVLVLNLFPSALAASHRAEQGLQADLLAQTLLNEQQSLAFDRLVIGPPVPLPDQSSDGVTYHRSLEIFKVPSSNESFLKGIRATIWWTSQHGDHRLIQEVWMSRVIK